jgi:hypothetical protein
MATRRDILLGAAGALLCSGVARAGAGRSSSALISAANIEGRNGGVLWRDEKITSFALPARGHGLARLPNKKLVVAGRRPGVFSAIVDPDDLGRPPAAFAAARECRFAGHVAVAPDGSHLITSEFDADTVQAVLVVRDAATGAARDQWRLNEIEPHELVFTPDGSRIIVAIGGLMSDGGVAGPAFNPGGAKSALLEIDPKSGRVLARHSTGEGLASLSMRHLALAPDGSTIAVGAQDQDLSIPRPLVGLLRHGRLELLPMPDEANFRGYVGSIAIDAGGDFVAAASPRGGLIGVWSLGKGSWIGALAVADVCGLTAGQERGAFWASSGHGAVLKIMVQDSGPKVEAQWHTAAGFDNHLLAI